MFQLLALAPEDGWAFVRRGEDLLLVKPPYSQWTLSRAEDMDLERALGLHGFQAEDQSFTDWGALIAHLRTEIVAAHEARGQMEPSSEDLKELVHFAPHYILAQYLDRIEKELIPNREWEPALDLLTLLLGVEEIKRDASLHERTVSLLESCRMAMLSSRKLRALTNPNREIEDRFPRASEQYGAAAIAEYARLVAQRRQVFAIGG
jgi:hypothetical protein